MRTPILVIGLTSLLALSACDTLNTGNNMHEPLQSTAMGFEDKFVSDITGVQEKHLTPAYWIQQGANEAIIMTPAEIAAFNAKNIADDPKLYDISNQPDSLSQAQVLAYVRASSNIPKYKRIYKDGTPVTPADFARYERLLNLGGIGQINPVKFALAVKRTSMRTYPTQDLLFSHDAKDRDIERFQESALFPGDAVAVLHTSTDGKWALVQSYNYIAWVPLSSLAVGTRAQVLNYGQTDNFLIVTGDKIKTVFNPEVPEVSELQLDMGVKLPLSRPKELQNNLYGQNPYLSHMVLLPVRTPTGGLKFKHALIQRNRDVHIGYLPYSQANIIRQSFKFLGERYGWGHRFNGRDCTGFVSEIYKTFGIKMSRNSGDQGRSALGINARYDKDALRQDKIDRLRNGAAGDLIYIPGHVMMLVGHDNGQPYVIHDVHGLGLLQPDGTLYKGTLNGVSLTPLLPLQSNPDTSYLDSAYTIKTVR